MFIDKMLALLTMQPSARSLQAGTYLCCEGKPARLARFLIRPAGRNKKARQRG